MWFWLIQALNTFKSIEEISSQEENTKLTCYMENKTFWERNYYSREEPTR